MSEYFEHFFFYYNDSNIVIIWKDNSPNVMLQIMVHVFISLSLSLSISTINRALSYKHIWTILIFQFDYLIKSCVCITGKHNKFFNSVSVVCMKFVNVV